MTMNKRTLSALYSTPPSSFICSSVNPVNLLFLPTVAAKEMYGTSLALASDGSIVPRPPIVAVRGMLMVLVRPCELCGKTYWTAVLTISKGVGNPPKPDNRVSGLRVTEGRRE